MAVIYLAARDAAAHGVADEGVAAAVEAEVLDERVHGLALGEAALLHRPLQLRGVHQHLLHRQHIH